MTKLYNKQEYTKKRRKLRRDMPKGEKLLWHHLKNSQLGYKFRRQYGIGSYTADFFCPKLKLCIEVDGLSHVGEDAEEHDKRRDAYMTSIGITVKRYTGGQVWDDLDNVKMDIYNTCVRLDEKIEPSRQPPLTPP
ncbi:MAG: hypothetical protein CO030_00505 [Candidatus Magasanikbacteria bacterium CG_4_9_14_0_2_um_filter_42_11]|uniref:DUF559 domain-containing protein n=1 Tax=Candidatus Magasanikbacteria bacterium CG_4_9_14_0_2_um_filter_42_11 TaxID=1974643 RepID=A0A2M8FB01_9BACT|nr:MAG: hypothetical protein COU34_01915 [Candidatus Magasanikbacteria bacterium CG10_big_fil_rev_8_21_14_0_10_43_9]PIY92346.1 MAG: hypothetical protein COY70_03730 [Candidatus Magasanikbacteria bacterium CG_4_10_14_0_8_um_filter_42_12]PJC52888.1 MAG: hypothetical protein CO030_00505 [Candidatus Magasanikbacteria bacterium CG_4_9_14_0_2_um_filter_42_11]